MTPTQGYAGPDMLRVGEAAALLHVSAGTLRRWDDAGRVPAYRSPSGQRLYWRADLERMLTRSDPAPVPQRAAAAAS